MRKFKGILNVVYAGISASAIILLATIFAYPQIMQIAGLAVAQSSVIWNRVQDAAVGDNLVNGLPATALYLFDGTNWDRAPGNTTDGLTVSLGANSGTNFFAILDTGITTASQNFAFGFTSNKVIVEAPATNTANICVDWLGGTAVCPSSDTAGDDVMTPGTSILLDFYNQTSVSAIAASGTQSVNVRAYN